MGYEELQLDVGQVFELRGSRNDEKLVRLELVKRVTKHDKPARCGGCQAEFVDEGLRDEHARARHRRKNRDDVAPGGVQVLGQMSAAVDTSGDAEARQLDQRFPLALDKTAASQKG